MLQEAKKQHKLQHERKEKEVQELEEKYKVCYDPHLF